MGTPVDISVARGVGITDVSWRVSFAIDGGTSVAPNGRIVFAPDGGTFVISVTADGDFFVIADGDFYVTIDGEITVGISDVSLRVLSTTLMSSITEN